MFLHTIVANACILTALSQNFVAADILYADQAAGDYECDRIPPTLYCKNENLTEACGLSQLCNRYRKASANQAVQITVLYESLCPDSQQFIVENLYRDVYLRLGGYVDIELVPYGNAKRQVSTRALGRLTI